jgi:hypothetical protein
VCAQIILKHLGESLLKVFLLHHYKCTVHITIILKDAAKVMRGKVIASGTQIIFKEFENVGILCVSASYVSELISGIYKF